jgi:PAS domain S-box-containing protein
MLALQRATHHLAAALDTAALLPFLREMRAGFDVQDVQLMLTAAEGTSVLRTYTCAADDSFATSTGPHPLAERLAATLTAPARFGTGRDEIGTLLADLGHTRLLAAPLRRGDRVVGVLLMFDRLGAAGFDAGEVAVAGAVARELVGFLDRVELVREIDEERRKLANVVDHTSDGIISIDSDGTILSWNAAFAAMTGYSAEEMVGTRHLGLLRPRDAEGKDLHVAGWAERLESTGLPPEMQVVTATGSTVWASCSYSVGPDSAGGLAVLIMVARNITQARELELLKDDFVAVVSHELRTPLVPIKGWAQTLLNRGDRMSDDQRRTAVQSILSQAQRLESLVLNILESSRVEAGHAESMGIVDIVAVAQRVVEDMRLARPERTVRATPPLAPLHVRGSVVWVEQAISNLLGNAVKYSADDEPVDIVLEQLGGTVVLSVTDRGPGIPMAAWERVFARFERLEGAGKQTGTGLGLYITRRLARAMGGDVTVSSVPGAGSTFVLALPAIGDGPPIPDRAAVGDATAMPLPRNSAAILHLS